MTGHGLAGAVDAGVFLARLTALDRAAPVRLRSAGERTALWARLPWGVLVTRLVAGSGPGDATVSAAELLTALERGSDRLPARRDEQWRWPLPPGGARPVESVPVPELVRLAAAAAGALRQAATAGVAGRPVGQRALRDALLDHVALTVTPESGEPVEVPQRLVQAVWRMGFLGGTAAVAPDGGTSAPGGGDFAPGGGAAGPPGSGSAAVVTAGRWIALSAPYGVAWLQPVSTLTLMRA